ncbi:MAG TPA: DsbA family protein [Acidimicrobiia bacterium]|nr:DsbA family protein [Acidimicrobiia bacterium]
MTLSFSVTFDYRCPFARNAHESVVAGVRAGRDWDVTFVPFSLDQVHADDDTPAVWDRPADERGTGVHALEWGIAVRDTHPERFFDWHLATFAARHDEGRRLTEVTVLRDVAAAVGLDADAIASHVAGGAPLRALATEHTAIARSHAVFGVPTFVVGEHAMFVRLMDRGGPDDIDRVLDLVEFGSLNELKHTRIPR